MTTYVTFSDAPVQAKEEMAAIMASAENEEELKQVILLAFTKWVTYLREKDKPLVTLA
jgi:hypothetical protein